MHKSGVECDELSHVESKEPYFSACPREWGYHTVPCCLDNILAKVQNYLA